MRARSSCLPTRCARCSTLRASPRTRAANASTLRSYATCWAFCRRTVFRSKRRSPSCRRTPAVSKRTVTKEELERPLIAYRDAVDQILSAFAPLPPEMIPLERALGLVAAEAIVAPLDVPGFDNSAMDGFAVRAADIDAPGTVLGLVDDLPAGSDPHI